MKLKKYIASWSGGKDSTFMVDELLRRGDPLDEIVFCDTGFEFPEMYDYILKCKEYWEQKYELKVTLLNWGNNGEIWKKWAEGEYIRGDHKGLIRGFPFPVGMSWCTRVLKVNPMKNHVSKHYSGCSVFEYIGIAVDEPKRIPEGWENGIKLYPMVTWQVTEAQARQHLIERGMHNPLYNKFHRTGCWLCPKQGVQSLTTLKNDFSGLWSELEEMDQRYTDLGAPKGFKNIGIEVINKNISLDNNLDLFGNEEPVGCFCK